MKKYIASLSGLAIAFSSFPIYSQSGISTEFHTENTNFFLQRMERPEKAIAALDKPQLAVFYAAGQLQRIAQIKKETGKFNQQQFTFILATALYRLSYLAQMSNLPKAAACHMEEARNLEKASKGKPLVLANCRTEAYGGARFQGEALNEVSKPSWKPIHKLVSDWTVNTFSYAESMGIMTNYGRNTNN